MINLSIMHNPRFYSYLSLFTFFMLVLISGDNLLIIFIGKIPSLVNLLYAENKGKISREIKSFRDYK